MVRLKGVIPSVLTYCTLVIFLYLFVVKPLLPKLQDHLTPSVVDQNDLLDEMDIDCEYVKNGTKPPNLLKFMEMRNVEDQLLYSKNR
ncbi:hypothetical protein CRE_08620 [Caenorhabditis remanei]|uniref:Uncharacterized protein n=1 Tax=Caenorhabditis remanei TaxID=31234 RepID=E3NVV5_CAERE|nr:hypothetical protein CRE_08620 [Caenorhabditis remanei]